MNEIKFYRANDPYGVFSNFDTKHPIEIDGVVWPTTEHYFQAMKFEGTPYEDAIREASSPAIAAKLGRTRELPIRSDWEIFKEPTMYKALWAKFTQHRDAHDVLLSTGDATLIEHTENDSYWGDGGDGSGKNRLGIMLMRLRRSLKDNGV